MVHKERLGAGARPPVFGAVAPSALLRTRRQTRDVLKEMRRDAAECFDDRRDDDRLFVLERVPVVAATRLD